MTPANVAGDWDISVQAVLNTMLTSFFPLIVKKKAGVLLIMSAVKARYKKISSNKANSLVLLNKVDQEEI